MVAASGAAALSIWLQVGSAVDAATDGPNFFCCERVAEGVPGGLWGQRGARACHQGLLPNYLHVTECILHVQLMKGLGLQTDVVDLKWTLVAQHAAGYTIWLCQRAQGVDILVGCMPRGADATVCNSSGSEQTL